jgi:predicted phosphodiesterase
VRVALISDVHGNLTALEAVIADIERRGVDLVIQGGDLALMGARPREVVERIHSLGWPGVVGNTDEVLWRPEEHERQLERAPRLATLLDRIFNDYTPHTRDRLGDAAIGWLRELPTEYRSAELTVVHAQPGDLWRAPMPDADDAGLSAAYAPLQSARVGYGHIHRPFVRALEGLTVANAGAVGLPFDHDPRASYLLVTDGEPEIVRVDYDVEREVRALRETRHPDADRLVQMLRTGRFVPLDPANRPPRGP